MAALSPAETAGVLNALGKVFHPSFGFETASQAVHFTALDLEFLLKAGFAKIDRRTRSGYMTLNRAKLTGYAQNTFVSAWDVFVLNSDPPEENYGGPVAWYDLGNGGMLGRSDLYPYILIHQRYSKVEIDSTLKEAPITIYDILLAMRLLVPAPLSPGVVARNSERPSLALTEFGGVTWEIYVENEFNSKRGGGTLFP